MIAAGSCPRSTRWSKIRRTTLRARTCSERAAVREVDVLRHERSQGEHRAADLLALHDRAGCCRRFHEVVHERVDPPRARLSQQLDLGRREDVRRQDPMAHGVVDVVVDVRDPVDDAHDAALERRGLLRPGVRVDPVANLGGQVQLLGDPQRLLVVAEAEPEALAQRLVERLFARMSERRVAHVMPEPDRLGEILVQAERPRDDPRDAGRLERVRHCESGSGRRRGR